MPKRCRYCFSRLKKSDTACEVCKIDPAKDKKLLTKEEKQVAYFCRSLYAVGTMVVLSGLARTMPVLPIALKTGTWGGVTLEMIPSLMVALVVLAFGLSLLRYRKWCYFGGIVLFGAGIIQGIVFIIKPTITSEIMNDVILLHAIAVMFKIWFLYYIISPVSRKILYRQL